MRYQIIHTTIYTYDRPVVLSPHVVRLRPRCDVTQSLRAFSLEAAPEPVQISDNIDLDGNAVLKLWFAEEAIATFTLKITSEVETHRTNPFTYLLEPWAAQLPLDYPTSLLSQLQPYLSSRLGNVATPDPTAIQLAQEIWQKTTGDTVSFLSTLNQHIHAACQQMIRETGDPLPPGVTWMQKAGSCRDLTILFMETCRAMGLATRFVSGYQEGDPDRDDRHLHAWAEVYLPGAGWRGYDPTQGLAVSDRHIALAASASSHYTAPVSGSLKMGAGVESHLAYCLVIEARG